MGSATGFHMSPIRAEAGADPGFLDRGWGIDVPDYLIMLISLEIPDVQRMNRV